MNPASASPIPRRKRFFSRVISIARPRLTHHELTRSNDCNLIQTRGFLPVALATGRARAALLHVPAAWHVRRTLVRPTIDFEKVCFTSPMSMRCHNSQRPKTLSRTPCLSIGPVFGEFVRAHLGTKLDQYLPIRLMKKQKPPEHVFTARRVHTARRQHRCST